MAKELLAVLLPAPFFERISDVASTGFTGTSLERFRVEDGGDHPFKRIVLTQSTGKAIFVLAQIPGKRLEIGMAKQLGDVGE